MSFKGLLNDVCKIYSRTESVDAETGEQTFTNTLLAEGVPCALQYNGGSIDRFGRLIKGDNLEKMFLLPQAVALTKQDTIIEVRGVQYRINEIVDLGGRKRFLRLNLERYKLDD